MVSIKSIKLVVIVSVLLILLNPIMSMANPANSVDYDHYNDFMNQEENAETDSGWFASVRKAFTDAAEAFKSVGRIFTDVGAFVLEFLFMAFAYFVGLLLDIILLPFLGVFSTNFLTSQSLSETPWVLYVWKYLWFISLALYAVALLNYAGKKIKGKPVSNDAARLLIGVLILNFMSFWLTEMFIGKLNEGTEMILAENMKIVAAATGEEQISAPYSTNLILKGFLSAQGENLSNINGNSFSQYLLQGDYSNTLPMMIIMLALIVMSLIAWLRFIIIRLLHISSPIYLVKIGYTGDMETMVGFSSLFIRSHTLQVIFAFIWMMSFRINADAIKNPDQFGGIDSKIITGIILWIGVIVAYKYWFVPTLQAVRYAGTLNGAAIIKGVGNTVGKASSAVAAAADNFGDARLSGAAAKLSDKARSLNQKGEEWEKRAEQYDQFQAKEMFAKESPILDYVVSKAEQSQFQGGNAKIDLMDKFKFQSYTPEYQSFTENEKYEGIQIPENIADEFIKFSEKNISDVKINKDPEKPGALIIEKGKKGKVEKAYSYFLKQSNMYWQNNKGKGYVEIQDGYPRIIKDAPKGGVFMGIWKGSHKLTESMSMYWKNQKGEIIITVEGQPVVVKAPPKDGIYMGVWKENK